VRWHVVAALRCLAEALEFQGHYEVQGAQHQFAQAISSTLRRLLSRSLMPEGV
jgi:hypothetical protein